MAGPTNVEHWKSSWHPIIMACPSRRWGPASFLRGIFKGRTQVDSDGHFQKVAICKGANTWEWLAISFRSVVLFRSVGFVSVPALKVTGDRFSTRQVTPGELKGTNKNTPRVGRAIGKSIYLYITCDRMGGPDMIC